MVGVSSYDFINELAKSNEEVIIHVEVGTGMGRTGVHPYKIEKFLKHIPKNVKVEGVYTHFSSADSDKEYTEKQLDSFKIAIDKAKKILGEIKYIHAAASNAILNFPDSYFNLVRPGMILYGYESCEGAYKKIKIKPIAK